jgi:hypothetical protein
MDSCRRAEWQIAGWSIFLLAFAFAGAVTFDGLDRNARVLDQGPTNSTDAAFARDLGVEHAAEQVERCLAPLPDGATIAVIFRRDSMQALEAQLLCQAAWMHGLRPITFAAVGPVLREDLDRAGVVAGFSLGLCPPDGAAESERLGGLLHFWRSREPSR